MSNGAIFDYKKGPKNNWRRTQWNRIVDYLPKPPKDAVVLYLAGENDLDRIEAKRRGFRDENLLIVEKFAPNVKSLRSQGKIVAHCRFEDAINDCRQPIDVVVGDFCGGVYYDLHLNLIYSILANQNLKDCVFAFNFLRGRETGEKSHIDCLREIGIKHRGYVFMHSYIRLITLLVHADAVEKNIVSDTPEDFERIGRNILNYIDLNMGISFRRGSKTFNSYKSGFQIFDSLVFRNFRVEGIDYKNAEIQYTGKTKSLSAAFAIRSQRLAA